MRFVVDFFAEECELLSVAQSLEFKSSSVTESRQRPRKSFSLIKLSICEHLALNSFAIHHDFNKAEELDETKLTALKLTLKQRASLASNEPKYGATKAIPTRICLRSDVRENMKINLYF